MNLTPVIPFEPINSTIIPKGDNWIAQIKWDGVRMLSYYDGIEVRLINRRKNDRTMQYPEFRSPSEYCSASSFIVDGELIAFDSNKPSFHEIMKRDSLRSKKSIEIATSQVPVTLMVFDVLYCNGEWVVNRSLAERQIVLSSIIKPNPHVQIVQNFTDADGLFDVMKTHHMEGIVYKNLSSTYVISGKDSRWQKRKLHQDLNMVIGGVTYRDKVVNSILLGVFSNGSLVYVGHAGAGKLTVADWMDLTSRIEPLIIASNPFANKPTRNKDAVWVRPEIVVKVQFMEWTLGKAMRHPTIQGIVANGSIQDCTFDA
ncbi:DNA ligase [Cohnella endophytica]|uniref:DNA ligase (ATP) n=1 Tax=Cohnella endophytica TaxID=2419778 RepID=A0A494XRE0_9BACL|nr:RNA ligase family protein [Cohnella endophytica]RKP53207.1 DNA ligase [Cohnella endophytica]